MSPDILSAPVARQVVSGASERSQSPREQTDIVLCCFAVLGGLGVGVILALIAGLMLDFIPIC